MEKYLKNTSLLALVGVGILLLKSVFSVDARRRRL